MICQGCSIPLPVSSAVDFIANTSEFKFQVKCCSEQSQISWHTELCILFLFFFTAVTSKHLSSHFRLIIWQVRHLNLICQRAGQGAGRYFKPTLLVSAFLLFPFFKTFFLLQTVNKTPTSVTVHAEKMKQC